MTRALAALAAVFALAAPAAAAAPDQHPTLADLEDEVMCPTCHTPLELSSSPAADRIRAFIRREIAAGKTKSEIKAALVDQFGEGVLAAPPARGFNLLAWLLPLVGGALAVVLMAFAARRWLAGRGPPEDELGPEANGRASVVDSDLERRLDEELARFDA